MNGRLHTNKDMYLGAGASLTVNSEHVQSYGKMYRERKDDGSTMAGAVNVKKAGTSPPVYMPWQNGLDSDTTASPGPPPRDSWATQATNNWNGSVKDKQLGASYMEAPPVESIQPDGYFQKAAEQGGIVIHNGRVYQGTVAPANDITGSLPAGTVVNGTLYDAREGTNVPVTTVDMGKLMGSAYRPKNGLVYATQTGATPGSPKGVQLINGGTIPPSPNPATIREGVTVVTDLPVYVKGDYNARTSPAGLPDPTHVKQPAAIISVADAGKAVLERLPLERELAVRHELAEACKALRVEQAIGPLIEWLNDPDEGVRLRVSKCLQSLAGEKFGPDYRPWAEWFNARPK